MSRFALVALGGALGASARYLLWGLVTRLTSASAFPWGTLAVNVVGSFLFGLLLSGGTDGRWPVPPDVRLFVGVGFLGSLTTFSTFSFETFDALRAGDPRIALANIALNVAVTLAVCWLGVELGNRILDPV